MEYGEYNMHEQLIKILKVIFRHLIFVSAAYE